MDANIWSFINKLTLVLCFSFYDIVDTYEPPCVPSNLRGWNFWTSKAEGQTVDLDKIAKGNTTWFEPSGASLLLQATTF